MVRAVDRVDLEALRRLVADAPDDGQVEVPTALLEELRRLARGVRRWMPMPRTTS